MATSATSGAAPSTPLRLAMVAGEASGDLLAGLLLGGLHQRWPGLHSFGIGGPQMAQHGFEAWWPHERLAVRGYVEVLRHYREILGIRNALAARLLRERPDAFIGVDAPDFNLGLEARLHAAGTKTIHFVSPSIWAWRAQRIHAIGRAVDHVLCLFPFEPAIYAREGIPATYVGHPLADVIPMTPPRETAREVLGVSPDAVVVALLPGSRGSEITHIAPGMLQAAVRMQREWPDLQFLLPTVPGQVERLRSMLGEHAPGVPIRLFEGRSHDVLAACDVTLIASGTATLEAALYKRPMVIVYRMNGLTWQLMRRMSLQRWAGLPNILLNDSVVPELIQGDARADAMARETLAWLDDAPRVARVQQRFVGLHEALRCDTARRATDAIAGVLRV